MHWIAATSLVAVSAFSPAGAAADLSRTVDFHIPRQPLDRAILEFSQQARIQVAVDASSLGNTTAPSVDGVFAAENALAQLLANTGLSFGTIGGTVAITRTSLASEDVEPDVSRNNAPTAPVKFAQNESSRQTLHPSELDTVVVSAQKRDERLQDVPVPVAVITATELTEQNQLRLQDYYTSVPSLSVAPVGAQSTQILSIRGINTGIAGNPSVGITIDDVPYGSSTNLGGGPLIPDIDPFDLARVEVLRGPQGTLYGASSLGGLIKFVTVDPSVDAVSGRIQGDVSGVHNGNETGYGLRGAVNLPVADDFALRLSGFGRRDPGYIDNPVRGVQGVNEDKAFGGRLSALWRPTDALSVRLSALYQQIVANGSSDVDSGLADLQQNYLPGIGGYHRRFQAYSATLKYKMGWADLTAVSGYNINSYNDSWDPSYLYGQFTSPLYGVDGAPAFDVNRTRKFTQEVRLQGTAMERLDWLAGVFYTHENSQYRDSFLAADANTGTIVGALLDNSFPTTFSEYAVFADLTYKVTSDLDVQVGARESHLKQAFWQYQTGPFASPDINDLETDANAFTFLVTPRYKLTADLMVYLRVASGYRAGGTNALIGGADSGLPLQYSPDKTVSYEAGIKGDVAEHRLTFDASLYYIDWKSIQLSLTDPVTAQAYVANAGRAKSQGIELSADARPMKGLKISSWVTYNDAVLKEGFPSASTGAGGAYGVPGDRLPYGSRFSGNISVDEDFPLTNDLNGFFGGTFSYVGNRVGEFTGSPDRQGYAGYGKTDLHTGVTFNAWTVNLYVNNLTDRRALLGGGLGSFPPFAFSIIQPRTVGLTVSKTF